MFHATRAITFFSNYVLHKKKAPTPSPPPNITKSAQKKKKKKIYFTISSFHFLHFSPEKAPM